MLLSLVLGNVYDDDDDDDDPNGKIVGHRTKYLIIPWPTDVTVKS